MHIDFVQSFLKELLATSSHLLEKITVDKSIYGKYNVAGVHQNEPEPVPNFFIPEKGVHFYDSDWFLTKDEHEYIESLNEIFSVSCASLLPNPKSMKDIIQAGINDWKLAICALAEVMHQLYNQTQIDVLVMMDDYNWCFRKSDFKSFRYSSIKKLNSSIPPEHMSLIRLFMKFDGHKIRRGFKVYGNSNRTIPKHYFSPEKINFNTSHTFPLKGMQSLKEVNNFQFMARYSNIVREKNKGIKFSLQLLMEAQGNFVETMNLLSYPEKRNFDTTFIGRKKKNKVKKFRDLSKIYNTID